MRHYDLDALLAALPERVYISIDLDALDCGIMPSVGTPEPGGLGWYELLDIVRRIAAKRRVVGMDIVELMPLTGIEAPNFLAAKLVFKMIGVLSTA